MRPPAGGPERVHSAPGPDGAAKALHWPPRLGLSSRSWSAALGQPRLTPPSVAAGSASAAAFQFSFQFSDASLGRVGAGLRGGAGVTLFVEGHEVTLDLWVPPPQSPVFPAQVQSQRVTVPVSVARWGLDSSLRSNDWLVLVVCRPDLAERNFHQRGLEMWVRMLPPIIPRCRQHGAVGNTDCWSRYGEPVAIG